MDYAAKTDLNCEEFNEALKQSFIVPVVHLFKFGHIFLEKKIHNPRDTVHFIKRQQAGHLRIVQNRFMIVRISIDLVEIIFVLELGEIVMPIFR